MSPTSADTAHDPLTIGRRLTVLASSVCGRVVSMEKRKEQLTHQEPADSARDDASDSSADEAEVDEFLDWRSKGTWK